MPFKRTSFHTVLWLLFILACPKGLAQFDAQWSQYMMAPGTFNPAVAGMGSDLYATVQNRRQWVGIENAGSTLVASVSLPWVLGNRKHGIGLLIEKESIGLFSTQLFQVQYAWIKPLEKGTLSIGFQGGILQEGFDATSIHIPTSDYHTPTETDMPSGTLEGIAPDMSAGIWYKSDRWWTGASVSHLLESPVSLKQGENDTNDNNPEFVASRTYYLTGGYNILPSNPLYTVQPSFLVKTDLTAWQMDLSARVTYKDKYWGGLGWRYRDAVVALFGIKLPQGLSIGYSYDIATSAVAKFSSGSHELFLGFTKKIGTETVSKKQKSVRIL